MEANNKGPEKISWMAAGISIVLFCMAILALVERGQVLKEGENLAIDIKPKDRAWTEEEIRALLEKMIPPKKPPKTEGEGSETLKNFLRRNYEVRAEYREQAIEELLARMMKSPDGNNFWASILEDLEEEQKQK